MKQEKQNQVASHCINSLWCFPAFQGQHYLFSHLQQAEESASCHQDVQQSQALPFQNASNQARGCHDDLHDPQEVRPCQKLICTLTSQISIPAFVSKNSLYAFERAPHVLLLHVAVVHTSTTAGMNASDSSKHPHEACTSEPEH